MRGSSRLCLILAAGTALAADRSSIPEGGSAFPSTAAFRLEIPSGMATGRVTLRAVVGDSRVANVLWTVDGVARRSAPPSFEAEFEVGPVPQERTVLAIALDDGRQTLYEQEAILNPGERGVAVEILSPLQGEHVSGRVNVIVRARVPADEQVASLSLDTGGEARPLPGDGSVRSAVVDVPDTPTPLSVRLRTTGGGVAEKTVVLNGRGLVTTSEAHIVDQMVGVYHGKEPLEGLTADDFAVRDSGGACEIREVRLLRDTPLAVGLLVDTSQSLMHRDALKQATANLFIERALGSRDRAFLTRFGPSVIRIVGWTGSKEALRTAVLALEDDPLAGTVLFEAIIRALYQFQGRQGARALVLITDGNPFEDDVPETAALEYARQSGVKIYALALPWTGVRLEGVREIDEEGKRVGRFREVPVELPPNMETLERITAATGGRTIRVRKPEDVPGFLSQIERDIRTQYLVSYVPNAKKTGSFHPVEIRTRKGRVQTSPGFFY